MSQQRSYQGDNEILVEENRRLYKWINGLYKELSSIKSRLPKNADGDVIFIGSTQYRHYHNGKIEELKVTGISGLLPDGDTTDGYTIGTKNRNCINTELHSTAESCRAAAEGGGE
jgi:hypothetical protein